MSDAPYTPTMAEIRTRASRDAARFGFLQELDFESQFDRWLAERDRRVAEDAWEDGYLVALDDALLPVSTPATANPYQA